MADVTEDGTEATLNLERTVFDTVRAVERRDWTPDDSDLDHEGLYGTAFGQNFEETVTYDWSFDVVNHMTSARGSEPLREWAHAQMRTPGSWADTVVGAATEHVPTALQFVALDLAMRQTIINEVGQMTLAQIAVVDNGGAALRLAGLRAQQLVRAQAIAERRAQATTFYDRWNTAFTLVVGGQRRFEAADLDELLAAAKALRWEQRERKLFTEGAPGEVFSNSVAGRFGARVSEVPADA
jgi:hypothetical protein